MFKQAICVLVVLLATSNGFTTFSTASKSTSLQAEMSRGSFMAGVATFAFVSVANAASMDQENRNDKTEQWETGRPSNASRSARYANARNQLNSNFAPIKSLTLERKSPVERLDLDYPDFGGYKKTYPGLFKEGEKKVVAVAEAPPAAAPPPAAAAPAAAE